jgi:dipeptidyl aminopeptidase/acylaminoacyl peptidase
VEDSAQFTQALDVSPDGRFLALHRGSFDQGDIWLMDLHSPEGPRPFLASSAHEAGAKFSPDGRWLAYTANATERTEVYVRSLASGGLACQVSTNGGSNPVWSRDGDRLYFKVPQGIMVAKLKSPEPLRFEAPTLFAQGRFFYSGISFPANYDVRTTPDGDRLLLLKSVFDEPEPQYATQLKVIVHFDELIRRAENMARAASP